MKICQFIIALSLIAYIFNENCYLTEGSKADDCKGAQTTLTDSHCCYIKGKMLNIDYDGCTEIIKQVYDDVSKYIKESNKIDGYDIKSIDCYSNYIKLGLISSLLFLF